MGGFAAAVRPGMSALAPSRHCTRQMGSPDPASASYDPGAGGFGVVAHLRGNGGDALGASAAPPPATVEAIRASLTPRHAVAGLAARLQRHPAAGGTRAALATRQDRTLVVHAPKTRRHRTQPRTVRLLAPLAHDLREWRLASGRPGDRAYVLPGRDGGEWGEVAYEQWRGRTWANALDTVGLPYQRPYSLGPSVLSPYIAATASRHDRVLGPDTRLVLELVDYVPVGAHGQRGAVAKLAGDVDDRPALVQQQRRERVAQVVEHLLRSTAVCHSVRSASDVPRVAAALCCGLSLPQRFHMTLVLSRGSESHRTPAIAFGSSGLRLRRLPWLCQAGGVVQRIEVQTQDGNDLFGHHQFGPESGVHG
jgi:hypothetical protein